MAACAHCGAPHSGEHVICKFCRHAVSAEAQRTAIPCPNQACRTLCRWGKQKCVACQTWLVVSCIFCGSLSPHSISNCMRCNEAFAGAPQRKAAWDQQRMQQQNMQQQRMQMQQVGVWGNVAAAFTGAAVGSMVSNRSYGYHFHDSCSSYSSCSSGSSSDTFDVSAVSDDSSSSFFDSDSGGSDFDFGGFDE